MAIRVVCNLLTIALLISGGLSGRARAESRATTTDSQVGADAGSKLRLDLPYTKTSDAWHYTRLMQQAAAAGDLKLAQDYSKKLGRLGSAAIEPCVALVRDRKQTPLVRRWAALALGEIGDPRAVETLIASLRESHYEVLLGATRALGMIGERRAVAPLIETLNNADAGVRAFTVEALGNIGDQRALLYLLRGLDDKDDFPRSSAAIALGKMGGERALMALIRALNDEHWTVRYWSAKSLGKLGEKSALGPLTKRLEIEKKTDVIAALKEAVEKLQN